MRIVDLFAQRAPVFSFEFFPPQTEVGERILMQTVERLHELEPSFVSVTYGAGGSTREKTIGLVTRIKKYFGIEAMAHLTCVGHDREELRNILDRLRDSGIENVLPLRGDPPKGESLFSKPENGFGFASELVEFVRAGTYPFCLAGAAYPEKHQECDTAEHDLANLKKKVDAGVDFLITQLFYDNADYFRFVKRVRDVGIAVPILPGIMPVTNVPQIERITRMCGARIPEELRDQMHAAEGDEGAVRDLGIQHSLQQCRELLAHGEAGIHFYTLNQSPATRTILKELRRES